MDTVQLTATLIHQKFAQNKVLSAEKYKHTPWQKQIIPGSHYNHCTVHVSLNGSNSFFFITCGIEVCKTVLKFD